MRSLERLSCAALLLPVLGATARAETPCTEINALPFYITAPGTYCLGDSLSYADGRGSAAISIESDDVVVDLKGHVLDGAPSGDRKTQPAAQRRPSCSSARRERWSKTTS